MTSPDTQASIVENKLLFGGPKTSVIVSITPNIKHHVYNINTVVGGSKESIEVERTFLYFEEGVQLRLARTCCQNILPLCGKQIYEAWLTPHLLLQEELGLHEDLREHLILTSVGWWDRAGLTPSNISLLLPLTHVTLLDRPEHPFNPGRGTDSKLVTFTGFSQESGNTRGIVSTESGMPSNL